MIKTALLTGFILCFVYLGNSQNKFSISDSRLSNSKYIQLDFGSDFFQDVYKEAANYTTITSIKFIKSKDNSFQWNSLPYMKAQTIKLLELDNISEQDFKYLQNKLSRLQKLQTLIIRNSTINNIPIEFICSLGVQNLLIKNCSLIDPVSVEVLFKSSCSLRKIQLYNCNIYGLEKLDFDNPSNRRVSQRGALGSDNNVSKKLKVVDLRNNKLASVGKQLAAINSLDSIFLSGNFIPNAEADLMFLKKSKVKYIETDSISPAANNRLRKANKKIEWVFTRPQTKKKLKSKSVFGHFDVNSVKYRVYSSAYIEYDRIFSNALFTINLDTASLDEVFWDTTNILRRNNFVNGQGGSFRLFREKSLVRKHITFGFNKQNKSEIFGNGKYIRSIFYKYHPEMTVFRRYKWIMVEPMTSRAFRDYSRTDFIDLRLKYDDMGKKFVLFLKKINGKVISLNVYPVKGNSKKHLSMNAEKYAAEYAKYLSSLAKRKRKHDREILKNKRKIYSSIARNKRNAWNVLRSYMSDKERAMTEKEWMDYYYNIVKYEEQALLSSYPEEIFLERKFKKMGFRRIYARGDSSQVITIIGYFVDNKGMNLPVKKVVIVDKTSMTYRIIYVKSLLSSIGMTVSKGHDMNMLIFLADRSVGMVSGNEIEDSFDVYLNARIESQIVSASLITISQILKNFEL